MNDLMQRLEQLSPEKRALLLARLKQQSVQRETIAPRADRSLHPLSFAQERLWTLCQIESDSPFYNISVALRILGPLDISLLEQSLNAIVHRHSQLRAAFRTEGGAPVQIVADEVRVSLPVEDVSHLWPAGNGAQPGREAALGQADLPPAVLDRALAEARRVFDLGKPPLLAGCVLRLGPQDHLLVLTLHHIVADGWSVGVIMQELVTLYDAAARGRSANLPPLPLEYADFADWQRRWLTEAPADGQPSRLQRQLAYWKEQLAGVPPLLELPTDRPRPAVRSSRGAVHTFTVGRQTSRRLRELAQREQTTLFVVLLSAFQTLLYRYMGQAVTDICVGVPMANRGRPEMEGLVGFFVNTVAIRGRFDASGSPAGLTFRQFLRQVHQTVLDAQENQDLPFEVLVEELQPQRSLSATPLVQVLFDLDNRPLRRLQLPGLRLTPVDLHTQTAKVDLTLFMTDLGEDQPLTAALEYSTDLWEEPTIARMAGHLVHLLEAIAADPDEAVSRLNLLSAAERQQILLDWNATTADIPHDRSLARLFEAQAERTPDAIAVVYDDRQLTYWELNARANQVAHFLRSRGVGPDVLVAVYMDRSVEMMLAFLGIVKAGGAYLPLDTQYPPERLAFMLRDGKVPVVLTQAHLAAGLPGLEAAGLSPDQVVRIDADWHRISVYPADNPPDVATPDHLAYVIYTSGSTGVPKGVAVPQGAITGLVFNTNYMPFWPGMRMAQVSNASFDAATWEIWGAWLHGGTLVGIPKEVALSPRELAAALRRLRIDALFLTTALFNLIASEVPDAFGSLEYVLFGGEAVDPRWVRRVLEVAPPRHLLHVYGPTECTTYSTWYEVHEVPPDAATVPIGAALSNTTLYVLDRAMQPVPVGVPGELYIGGPRLARGYLHRPELTAERFVPDPFAFTGNRLSVISDQSSATDHRSPFTDRRSPIAAPRSALHAPRLYKTGDLVRWRPDGAIEFLGRVDHQVKVRGFRIELGEIETALQRHPAVQEAVVLAREDVDAAGRKERRLVVYVVPKPDAAPTASDLRTFLRQHLPEYMVPSAVVFMTAFPLNPNGKVDRRALPAPDQARPELDRVYVAPRTAVERFLVAQWREVLGLERIGIYDNFFELGGNSLQAAVVINRIQELTGVSTHVRALFMAPTVADLALYMAEYYPEAVARIEAGEQAAAQPTSDSAARRPADGHTASTVAIGPAPTVDAGKVALLRRIVQPLPQRLRDELDKNPPAVFVLSPPRSGSTLLRVMLAGNPKLFAPPELDLLSFNTLAERRATFSGRFAFWLEGLIRAVMEIKGCSAEEAEAVIAEHERQGFSTKAFYRRLQEWIGDRLLVDKTPVYSLDPLILQRIEEDFAEARYIHLLRHPYAAIHSFTEARLDQLFFRYEHPFTLRELGEMVWLVSHQNILDFLAQVPAHRQHRVWFEELVNSPEPVMRGVCDFLGVPYDPAMLEPYAGDRMTSGIRPDHQMVGDFKFYLRNRIDPKAADRWKRLKTGGQLSDMTWEVAEQLGYRREEATPARRAASRLTRIEPVPRPPAAATLGVLAANPLPLSFAQQRLWFLDQLEPGSPFYNVPAAVRLRGQLDLSALRRALNAIVQRHEVLRTTFPTVDGKPVPVIVPQVDLPVPLIDLRQEMSAAQTGPVAQSGPILPEEALRLMAIESQRPFRLDGADGQPLLRAQVLRLGDEEHILQVTLHHIVADGWSVKVFVRELAALYDAFRQDQPSPLPDLPVQYVDYAAWQRRWLEEHTEQMNYWQRQLAGAPPLLELPTDRPRPPVQTLRGRRFLFTLPPTLSRAVRALAREAETTLFTTLLSAFAVLLHRYSGQTDLCIGTPVAGRNRREIEGLIGFFVNTLVLRCQMDRIASAGSAGPSFRQLVAHMQEVALEAYDHQDIPFESLVDALQPERDMSRSPLFQVMFSLQEATMRAVRLPGVTVEPIELDSGTAKFDLNLSIVDRPEALAAALEYNTDLFDEDTIRRMAGHFQTLLEGIVADPDRPVGLLPLLTPAERQQILVDWNATDAPFDTEGTLHERFSQQARRTPDAVAVMAPRGRGRRELRELEELGELEERDELEALTYSDLDRRSNQLAHHLVGLGVRPGDIVGLMTERSTDTLVGLFGIL
ncbi:MAG: amino acid adenylation domain-containing protein, partial [Anaerolineae bacterium]|nr:amino acid adenylation domain-containing protein [Anaerolineae bacterium]